MAGGLEGNWREPVWAYYQMKPRGPQGALMDILGAWLQNSLLLPPGLCFPGDLASLLHVIGRSPRRLMCSLGSVDLETWGTRAS